MQYSTICSSGACNITRFVIVLGRDTINWICTRIYLSVNKSYQTILKRVLFPNYNDRPAWNLQLLSGHAGFVRLEHCHCGILTVEIAIAFNWLNTAPWRRMRERRYSSTVVNFVTTFGGEWSASHLGQFILDEAQKWSGCRGELNPPFLCHLAVAHGNSAVNFVGLCLLDVCSEMQFGCCVPLSS